MHFTGKTMLLTYNFFLTIVDLRFGHNFAIVQHLIFYTIEF